MSTAELKNSIHQLVYVISDNQTLKAIYTLLSKQTSQEKDWWDELSAKEKATIEKGLKDIKSGRLHSHEEVIAKSNALIRKHKK